MSGLIDPNKLEMQAVIFLSAHNVSMIVTAKQGEAKPRLLDGLTQPLDLAREIFSTNHIARETMDQCVRIIGEYSQLLEEYKLAGPLDIQLRASNIFYDLDNLDTVINRINIASGLRLQVMDDGEMTRMLYLQARKILNKNKELRHKRVLMLHVGPGNTRVMVFEEKRINFYACYRNGASRTAEDIGSGDFVLSQDEPLLIRDHLRGAIEQIHYDYERRFAEHPDAILILTPEFQSFEGIACDGTTCIQHQLDGYISELAQLPLNQRVERYNLSYASVRSFLPTLVFYQIFIRQIQASEVMIYADDTRYNYLRMLLPSVKQNKALAKEVIHFSTLLASRYLINKAHGDQVAHLSAQLFDQLQSLHKLGAHDKLLLHVASILHEVGTAINAKQHHHHSQYIILNSEHFGLSQVDVEIVALLARYHRHGAPSLHLRLYAEMEEKDRLRVQKLAALLRIADAMERSHATRIREFTVKMHPRLIELIVPDAHDLSIENLAMRTKANLFTDIFGYDIILVAGAGMYSINKQ